ncbi:Metalloprotease LoiP [Burkholderiales bacterium]|nr:Metalloprotease LoiP [Burkholderiales bacterium]
MNSATNLEVVYLDGTVPLGQRANLLLGAGKALLISSSVDARYDCRELRVSPRVGAADRFINLPDGGQLLCQDRHELDALPQEEASANWLAWLERRWVVAMGALVALVALLAALYVHVLPLAAEKLAHSLPMEYEAELGRLALHWLDENHILHPSKIEPARQEVLRRGFARLAQGLPQQDRMRLELRHSRFIGSNAFALPGGVVVITDAMIEKAEKDDEIYAVLAHEIGHVERRHVLRLLLQDSATAVIAATVTADAAAMTTAVAGLPLVLAQAKYARELETEADDFAFDLLRARGLSPNAFADIMERLTEDLDEVEETIAYAASHPVSRERVARARAAAQASASPGN